MNEREKHILTSINRRNQHLLGTISSLARNSKIRWGRATTTGNDFDECGIRFSSGDFIIEFISTAGSDYSSFVSGAERILGSANVSVLDANVVKVSL